MGNANGAKHKQEDPDEVKQNYMNLECSTGSDTEEYSSDFEPEPEPEPEPEVLWGCKSSYQIDINTFSKNKLDQDSLKLDYAWMYSAYDQLVSAWWFMPFSTATKLEDAYQKDPDKIATIGTFEFNFEVMKQRNNQTNTFRHIMRLSMEEYNKLVTDYRNNLDNREIFYACRMNKGYLLAYPPNVQDQIASELAQNNYSETMQPLYVDIGNNSIELDLKSMKQITASGTRQIVEVRPDSEEKVYGSYGYNMNPGSHREHEY